jgi:hypothetical protein
MAEERAEGAIVSEPEIVLSCTWHYMVDGSIVIEEVGQPLKVIDCPQDGPIRCRLQCEGPAMSDPPIRLATDEENCRWASPQRW